MPSSTTTTRKPAKKAASKRAASRAKNPPVAPPAAAEPQGFGLGGTVHSPETAWEMELTLPTGHKCLARRTSLESLMMMGILPQVDRLSAIVDEKHIKRVKRGSKAITEEEVDSESVAKDPASLKAVLSVADKVVEYCIIEPKVSRAVQRDDDGAPVIDAHGNEVPLEPKDRQDGVLYMDTVPLENRMFVFNWAVGGSADLDRFLRESNQALGDEDAGEGASPASE